MTQPPINSRSFTNASNIDWFYRNDDPPNLSGTMDAGSCTTGYISYNDNDPKTAYLHLVCKSDGDASSLQFDGTFDQLTKNDGWNRFEADRFTAKQNWNYRCHLIPFDSNDTPVVIQNIQTAPQYCNDGKVLSEYYTAKCATIEDRNKICMLAYPGPTRPTAGLCMSSPFSNDMVCAPRGDVFSYDPPIQPVIDCAKDQDYYPCVDRSGAIGNCCSGDCRHDCPPPVYDCAEEQDHYPCVDRSGGSGQCCSGDCSLTPFPP